MYFVICWKKEKTRYAVNKHTIKSQATGTSLCTITVYQKNGEITLPKAQF